MNLLDVFLLWEKGKTSSHEFCLKFAETFKEDIAKHRKQKLDLKKKIKRYMVKEE